MQPGQLRMLGFCPSNKIENKYLRFRGSHRIWLRVDENRKIFEIAAAGSVIGSQLGFIKRCIKVTRAQIFPGSLSAAGKEVCSFL